ncbi:MAG: lysophospholipid acyltransferase family protein [Flavobacterium sp.]|nr:lysophospholipid acyltransferase family protein [Flavobacterium sp.]
MKFLKRLLQITYCIYALLIFICIMFVALPFVLLSLLGGKIKGGNFIYRICKLWSKVWYFFIGIKHQDIYEAPHDATRQYIFVANHISYMDVPPAVISLNQPYRVLGKYEMVKYPVFGWIYRAAVILVDRSSPERRAKSFRALKAALTHGISIFLFPEGTFNETGKPLKEFFDGAFRLAIETQTPIKPLLFVDTNERLNQYDIFSLTPGISRVVYLAELSVNGYTKSDVQKLKQLTYEAMEAALLKYRNN